MKQNDRIDILISRYLDGTSTLDEERALREYFTGDSIDPAYAGYRDMFRAFDDIAIPDGLDKRLFNTIGRLDSQRRSDSFGIRRFMLRISAIAAGIAIVLSIAIPSASSPADEDVLCGMTPEEVASHTAMALQLMSRTISAGQNTATRTIESLSADNQE